MAENRIIHVACPLLGFVLFVVGVGVLVKNGVFQEGQPDTKVLWVGIVITFLGVGMISPQAAQFLAPLILPIWGAVTGRVRRDEPQEEPQIAAVVSQYQNVVGALEPPPPPDQWYTKLRPVLHQAAQYSAPTYYLDSNYHIVDWNVGFELIFSRITAKLRGKHVNWFIARLDNSEEVFAHAQEFSQREIPLVDLEPLVFSSRDYGIHGKVRFLKVASQLHDDSGNYRGWAVALMIQQVNWTRFQDDLREKLTDDKIWSVYSASYDAVLLEYPGYKELVGKVMDVVSANDQSVVDLGAGTGNVTKALYKLGHRITAVENTYAMLDRLRSKAKAFDPERVKVVKSSIEHLGTLGDHSFDAAVMVNVLYAVDDPLACLQGINRILKQDGVLGFSTTHRDIELQTLLGDIKAKLQQAGTYDALADDYERVLEANRRLEPIARRYTKEQSLEWVQLAGFEVTKVLPSEYQGAVMVVHARKVREMEPDSRFGSSVGIAPSRNAGPLQ
jgi:ubiquinone/menaquinone biosynthesis C-methylase UbiE